MQELYTLPYTYAQQQYLSKLRGFHRRTLQEDEEGCLKTAFWAMSGAAEIYAQDPEKMQVLHDTKACFHRLCNRA